MADVGLKEEKEKATVLKECLKGVENNSNDSYVTEKMQNIKKITACKISKRKFGSY